VRLFQKKFKIDKTKKVLDNKNLFLFQLGNPSSKEQVVLIKEFTKLDICISKVHNALLKRVSMDSGHKRINSFIQGPLFTACKEDSRLLLLLRNLSKISEYLTFLCLKFDRNLYTKKEVSSFFLSSDVFHSFSNIFLRIKAETINSYSGLNQNNLIHLCISRHSYNY